MSGRPSSPSRFKSPSRQTDIALHASVYSPTIQNSRRPQIPREASIARANPGGLSPAIATVFFLLICAAFLIGFSTLRAINGHAISTGGVIEQGPDGLIYRNPGEHLSIEAPDTWTSSRTQDSLTTLQGGNTSVILLEKYSMSATKSVYEADLKAMLGRHPAADISYSPVAISNHDTESFDSAFVSTSGVRPFISE